MPFKPFAFEQTKTVEPGDRNWRILGEATESLIYTPTLFNPVGTVTVKPAYFVLYGPLVFYSITLIVAASSGWNNNSYLTLPYSLLQPVSSVPIATSTAPVVIGASGTLLCWADANPGNFPTLLNLNTAHTNPSAVLSETVNINGWYVRN